MGLKKSITNFWIELYFGATGLVMAILTPYITYSRHWSISNKWGSDRTMIVGPSGSGLFNRCYSRFKGDEFTCDNFAQPFWTLPVYVLFGRIAMTASCVLIILSFLCLLLSMSCVMYMEISPHIKQILNWIAWSLRTSSVILTFATVCQYSAFIIVQDLRNRVDAKNAFPTLTLVKYNIYMSWDKCIYIGYFMTLGDMILLTYWLCMLMNPSPHCQSKYTIGLTKLPEYYEYQKRKKLYQLHKHRLQTEW